MIDRLALWLTPLSTLCVAGAVVIAGLSFGWHGVWLYVVAGLLGLAAGVPTALFAAKAMKKPRPDWEERRGTYR